LLEEIGETSRQDRGANASASDPGGPSMLSTIQTIVVPTDFSPFSDVAVRSAATIGLRDAAAIHLLHVIRLPFFHTTYDLNVPETIWESLRGGAQARMDETQRALEQMGVIEVHQILTETLQPPEAIVRATRDLDADLVVMATHGRRGFKHALLGSVTERTLRSCSIPVLSVKGHGLVETPLRRILVATDFSSHANLALSVAISLARRSDAQLDIVHVLDESPAYVRYLSNEVATFENQARAIADERLDQLGAKVKGMNLPVTTHLETGIPGEILAAEADRLGADLIVMGTHGHTGFTHMTLGSVAEATLRLAPCSVLTIRTEPEDRDREASG
jgi:nucleotide-binding universal stress UspA family protein